MSNEIQTNWYSLSPVDAWFFRDGRPSNRDEDQSELQSLFPPHNQTLVGAIRAAIAREMGWPGTGDWKDSMKAILGDGFDDLGQLSFTGPFLAKDGVPLFPLPSHVCGTSTTENGAQRFSPRDWLKPSDVPIMTDAGKIHLPVLAESQKPADNEKAFSHNDEFFISGAALGKVLKGDLPSSDECIHRERLFVFESRVGIERKQATGTTGENAMYSPSYVRLHRGVSLLIGVLSTVDVRIPSFFPLGGESRMATCTQVDAPTFPTNAVSGQVLYLATPAYFANGEWYGAGPSDSAAKLHSNLSGSIYTTRLDRPLWIGGFDSRKGTKGPLPLTPHVRPNTVWWLEQEQTTGVDDLRLGQRSAYGYGHAFIGCVPRA